jgi:endonuclease/exonuclease/phosphatase family metal-dependent hydrolase
MTLYDTFIDIIYTTYCVFYKMVFDFYTWNVLHMIHEIKYCLNDSHIIAKYSIRDDSANEQKRLDDIVNEINTCFTKHDNKSVIMCLQEVSGDLLNKIKNTLNCAIYSYQVARIPKDITKSNVYIDNSENIVILVSHDLNNTFWPPMPIQFQDSGKAALVVRLEHYTIVSIHVPFGDDGVCALKNLFNQITLLKPIIIAGDFNKEQNRLLEDFKNIQVFDCLRQSTTDLSYTYKRPNKTSVIDHVFVFDVADRLTIKSNNVIDEDKDLSDHLIVHVEFN